MEANEESESYLSGKSTDHYRLIETFGNVEHLKGEFTQLDKRLDEIGKRVDDQWKSVRLWLMLVGIILGGLEIALLVATLI